MGDKNITKHTFKGLSTGLKGEFLDDTLEELLGIKLLNVTSVKTIYINISSQKSKRSCH